MGSSDIGPVPRSSIPMFNPPFSWSVGNWMEYFFDGMKEGKLRASKCPKCGRVFVPPRMVCEICMVKNEDWVELPLEGTVVSFTRAFTRMGANGQLEDLASPEIIAMVKHEGADTCLVGSLKGSDCSVGMKVKAVIDSGAENPLGLLAGYEKA